MIKELIEMQRELDKSFLEANGLESVPLENYYYAILDELGELNHELKANWCWWKKTQAPVNQDKVLEELVDVWHFVLSLLGKGFEANWESIENHIFHSGANEDFKDALNSSQVYEFTNNILTLVVEFIEENCSSEGIDIGVTLCGLTYKLGFTMEQVYEAYITKNKENYDRIKRGY